MRQGCCTMQGLWQLPERRASGLYADEQHQRCSKYHPMFFCLTKQTFSLFTFHLPVFSYSPCIAGYGRAIVPYSWGARTYYQAESDTGAPIALTFSYK